ncbi:glucose-6-phosphate isomerase [Viridibacillus sp. YIM B01967]|uniref:Glucose-6-phosphate isomerase n=1 Tax=Viridibacillus soli TaxID=2798301 RepID=A0ABS1H845_9BACL|nr:glucose-6-phosphate isomerase [Viridibacillus soli]MBK3495592.1 glucose-6-phosphate isomerase [Viridibacillus soli]
MQKIVLRTQHIEEYANDNAIRSYQQQVSEIHQHLHASISSDTENIPTGWLQDPLEANQDLIAEIECISREICRKSDILIVIGVGGSYLGAKAIHDALGSYFTKKDDVEVIFIGNQLSSDYLNQLMDYIQDKEVYVNVISKSGTTLEPAINFRIIREFIEKKYGFYAQQHIIVTTDQENGLLKKASELNNYRHLTIPENIGGRFSVLTPVGLLPAVVCGVNIRDLLAGASSAATELSSPNLDVNPAYQYAVIRNILLNQGHQVEILSVFEPKLKYFQEWWKQLFGESEGKNHTGIFPTSTIYTTDLHSIGQYVQDGRRFLFETILSIAEPEQDITVPFLADDFDALNYLTDKSLHEINTIAKDATMKAHANGAIPVIELNIEKLDAYHLGYLFYFFMKACAMSAYLLNVNPFDQPGVEEYKKNISSLLNSTSKEYKLS